MTFVIIGVRGNPHNIERLIESLVKEGVTQIRLDVYGQGSGMFPVDETERLWLQERFRGRVTLSFVYYCPGSPGEFPSTITAEDKDIAFWPGRPPQVYRQTPEGVRAC